MRSGEAVQLGKVGFHGIEPGARFRCEVENETGMPGFSGSSPAGAQDALAGTETAVIEAPKSTKREKIRDRLTIKLSAARPKTHHASPRSWMTSGQFCLFRAALAASFGMLASDRFPLCGFDLHGCCAAMPALYRPGQFHGDVLAEADAF